jgi:hypothetical protein
MKRDFRGKIGTSRTASSRSLDDLRYLMAIDRT